MRLSRVALALIALPMAVGAQQPPANPITTVMKQRTMVFQQRLAQAFDSIPERLFNYKPTAPQLTIGYIAQHLADDNYFFCNQFGAMKGTRVAKDTSTADSVKATWPKADLTAKLKESFDFCEKAFAQLDDGQLQAGLDALIDAIPATTDGERRDDLRRSVVGILDELGVEHPVARESRRRLASALY